MLKKLFRAPLKLSKIYPSIFNEISATIQYFLE